MAPQVTGKMDGEQEANSLQTEGGYAEGLEFT